MEKKNLLVTPLKQIALNGNRREVLPGLSRTWAGEIMPADATTLPSLGTPVCAVVHSTGRTACFCSSVCYAGALLQALLGPLSGCPNHTARR